METNFFNDLNAVNVNGHVETKNGLSYLTWSWAWAETLKRYPNATYTIWKNENGLPYVYDEKTGYMVFTSVTIEEITHEMWLPVMDGANKAMKAEPYEYTVRSYGKETTKTVAAATMFDINKTIMRCMVKNLAMFGLGLYIYSGCDLPEEEKEAETGKTYTQVTNPKVVEASARASVIAYCKRHDMSEEAIQKICKCYKIESLNDMTLQQAQHYINALEKNGGNINE